MCCRSVLGLTKIVVSLLKQIKYKKEAAHSVETASFTFNPFCDTDPDPEFL